MSKYILAIATLSGTIIGVGFLSLPYITARVGIFVMLGYFAVLSSIVILTHFLLGKVALETPDFKRLPGYAEVYLGKWGGIISFIVNILGTYGTMLAFIIIGGKFLADLFHANVFVCTSLYFIAGSALIYFGIKAISKVEFLGLVVLLLALTFVFLQSLPAFQINNLLVKTGGISDIFLPYGPILFALWGASLIPEVEEMLGKNKKMLGPVIFIGSAIPVIVYLFFIVMVVGISGAGTAKEAVLGLKDFLGNGIASVTIFAGVLSSFTSFLLAGLTLKKIFWYDLKVPKNVSWLITCIVPFVLFLIGIKDFIGVIGFVGAVMLAIDGILIMLMYRKIKENKLRFLTYPLILVFVAGIIYEIIYLFQ